MKTQPRTTVPHPVLVAVTLSCGHLRNFRVIHTPTCGDEVWCTSCDDSSRVRAGGKPERKRRKATLA